MTMEDFVESGPTPWDEKIKNVGFKVSRGATLPTSQQSDWQTKAVGYHCTLSYQGRQIECDFWQGRKVDIEGEPDLDLVLHSLVSDASSPAKFEEFCDSMGYNSDSRTAEKTHRACLQILEDLKLLFGEDYPKFANIDDPIDESEKSKGRIVRGGMGGFLNPPGHPEASFSVEYDLGKPKCARGMASLAYVAANEHGYFEKETQGKAVTMLAMWNLQEKLPLDHDDVQEWIVRVMGYYKNVWVANGRHVSQPTVDPVAEHAGVRHIRKFYADFTPTSYHWKNTQWAPLRRNKRGGND